MPDFEIGDVVVITATHKNNYYSVGDKAILARQTIQYTWVADFTINPNYYKDGCWNLTEPGTKFELLTSDISTKIDLGT